MVEKKNRGSVETLDHSTPPAAGIGEERSGRESTGHLLVPSIAINTAGEMIIRIISA